MDLGFSISYSIRLNLLADHDILNLLGHFRASFLRSVSVIISHSFTLLKIASGAYFIAHLSNLLALLIARIIIFESKKILKETESCH